MTDKVIPALYSKTENHERIIDKIPKSIHVSVGEVSYFLLAFNPLEIGRAVTLIGEESILLLLQDLINPGDVFYDIGANIGTHTLFLSQAKDDITVFSFEAEKKNSQHLKTNVFYNGYDNIYLFSLAIGSKNATQELFLLSNTPGEGGNSLLPAPHLKSQTVSVYTLDSIISSYGLPCPSLVKIDVEGYEVEVIKGMNQTLKACGPVLLIEVHKKKLKETYGDEDILEKALADINYTCVIVPNEKRKKEIFILANPV